MDKKKVGLMGVVTAVLALPATVQAAPAQQEAVQDILSVSSYGDLLNPIPNAGMVCRFPTIAGDPDHRFRYGHQSRRVATNFLSVQ